MARSHRQPATSGSGPFRILWHRLSVERTPLTIWWTDGSALVEPSCLFLKGLPAADSFGALLDGSWREPRWRSVTAEIDADAPTENLPVAPASLLRFRSAAASDVGLVRKVNEDAFVELSEVGLWAVADGLGGHADGEYASRMVCDAFADFAPAASLDDAIEAVRQRMHEVNDHLFRASTDRFCPTAARAQLWPCSRVGRTPLFCGREIVVYIGGGRDGWSG